MTPLPYVMETVEHPSTASAAAGVSDACLH